MSEMKKVTVQSRSSGHATSFAGLFGYATTETSQHQPDDTSTRILESGGGVLMGPEGRWAIRLTTLNPAQGEVLLRVLNDLSPLANPTDATLSLRISAYDEAAANDPLLAHEIRTGLIELDTLARRMMDRGYNEIAYRSLRRPLLMQMAHHPLFERLGIGHSTYAPVANAV